MWKPKHVALLAVRYALMLPLVMVITLGHWAEYAFEWLEENLTTED